MSDQTDFLNQYFEMCDFSDECDICDNEKQEQSWAIMTCCNEVEQYLCTTCAMTLATRWKRESDGEGCEDMNSDKCCVCGVQGESLESTSKGSLCWSCIEDPHLDASNEGLK